MTGKAVVIGASGGIGGALVKALIARGRHDAVHALSRSGVDIDGAISGTVDIEDETSIKAAADHIGSVRTVIVATGLLHDEDGFGPEKSWRALDRGDLMRAFAVNSVGPALLAKHFLPRLEEGRSLFAALSARVGSISDNRLGGWYGYRASKAALNQLIRTLSIELTRRNADAICVALHPGTVDTALSAPFQGNVPEGKLFTPDYAAERLLSVLDELKVEDTGRLFAWDGAEVAP